MIRSFLFSLALVAAASQLQATEFKSAPVNKLIYLCRQALDQGDLEAVSKLADELVLRKNYHLSAENRAVGSACLSTAFGYDFEFAENRFVSQEREAIEAEEQEAALRIQKALVRLRLERARLYEESLEAVCNDEFFRDRFRAPTTPACAEIFIEHGLPE